MPKITEKGYTNIIFLAIILIGLLTTVILVKKPTNLLPKAYDQYVPSSTNSAPLEYYLSLYINSARKNIMDLPDGRKCIIPSQAYTDGIYERDAFYSVTGLEDFGLSWGCFIQFERSIDERSGQVRYAIPIGSEGEIFGFGFKDDESNLLYLIWAGILDRRGFSVDKNKIQQVYSFINNKVSDGWFISPAGNYHYWADTYMNREGDSITYNQGLYALSLQFVKTLNPNLVSGEVVAKAVSNYRSQFGKYRPKFLPLSKNTNYQDLSSLLPEFLARLFLNEGMLSDDQVLASVDEMILRASVYDNRRNLQGIKITFASDQNGSFLPSETFKSGPNYEVLYGGGDYQNGGYWPMYTLADLSMAYKISGLTKYKDMAQQLIERELINDGRSKEFFYLMPGRLGTFDEYRSDYSWNSLIALALKWSGMVR